METSAVDGPLSPSTWRWIEVARRCEDGRVRNSAKYGEAVDALREESLHEVETFDAREARKR